MKALKPLTKEQRIKVYRRARNLFKKENEGIKSGYVNGMCDCIYHAMKALEYATTSGYGERPIPATCDNAMLKKYWPEFAKHKPASPWSGDHRYWFTRWAENGGFTERMKVLTAIGEYKKFK